MSIAAPTSAARLFAGRRGLLFATILFTNFVVWLDTAKFGLLVPFWSADLHMTPSQISSVTASYLLGYFPLLLCAGVLADRIGAKKMLVICVAGVTVLSGSMAFVHTYTEMWWRNLVFGIFFGFLWAPCQRLIAMWFPGAIGARATSTWMSSTLVAGVVAPVIALPIAHHISWQAAFLVVAALGVPAFFGMLFFVSDSPEKLRGITAEEAALVRSGHVVEAREKISIPELLRALKNRSILTMVIATGLATTPTWLSGPWVPYGLITLDKVNPDTVAWVSPLLALIPVGYGLIHGSFVAKFFGGRTRPWLIIGPLCGVLGFGFGIVFHSSNWVIWGFMIAAFAFLVDPMFWGTINSYWSGIARPEVTGTLNGISAALQVAVGWFIVNQSGHWVTAAHDKSALNTVWLVGVIIFAVTIIPVLLSKEIRVHRTLPHGPMPAEVPPLLPANALPEQPAMLTEPGDAYPDERPASATRID